MENLTQVRHMTPEVDGLLERGATAALRYLVTMAGFNCAGCEHQDDCPPDQRLAVEHGWADEDGNLTFSISLHGEVVGGLLLDQNFNVITPVPEEVVRLRILPDGMRWVMLKTGGGDLAELLDALDDEDTGWEDESWKDEGPGFWEN